jgi:hypothetical protein
MKLIMTLSTQSPTIYLQMKDDTTNIENEYTKYIFQCYVKRFNKLFKESFVESICDAKNEIILVPKLSVRILKKVLIAINRILSLGGRSG